MRTWYLFVDDVDGLYIYVYMYIDIGIRMSVEERFLWCR